jgi:hypothetical protein
MLFERVKLTDALRQATDGWSGDASAVDEDVAREAANLLDLIRATCDTGLKTKDTRSALMHIKYLIDDAVAPYFPSESG